MKKIIFSLTVFLLTLSWATSVKAGALENQVMELFKQAPFLSEGLNGTEQITFKVDSVDVITQPGVKVKRETSQFKGDFKLSTDHINDIVELKGIMYITDASVYMDNYPIPFDMIVAMKNETELKAMYLYIYPEYVKMAQQKLYTTAFDQYSGVWLRIDGSELKKTNQDTSVSGLGATDAIWSNTNWFTVTSKKLGTKTVYSVKVKPAVLIANMNKLAKAQNRKLSAKQIKSNKDLVDSLAKGKIEINAESGKLAGYPINYTPSSTNTRKVSNSKGRKVTATVKTTNKIGIQGSVLVTEPIVIPTTNVKDFSIEKFVEDILGKQTRDSGKTNEQIVAERVEKLITLSVRETPMIYTVTSIEELRKTSIGKNSLFMYAQDGDIVLMYEKNNKVLLYRPAYNTIVGEVKYDGVNAVQ